MQVLQAHLETQCELGEQLMEQRNCCSIGVVIPVVAE
jgi:hypothetical protein